MKCDVLFPNLIRLYIYIILFQHKMNGIRVLCHVYMQSERGKNLLFKSDSTFFSSYTIFKTVSCIALTFVFSFFFFASRNISVKGNNKFPHL